MAGITTKCQTAILTLVKGSGTLEESLGLLPSPQFEGETALVTLQTVHAYIHVAYLDALLTGGIVEMKPDTPLSDFARYYMKLFVFYHAQVGGAVIPTVEETIPQQLNSDRFDEQPPHVAASVTRAVFPIILDPADVNQLNTDVIIPKPFTDEVVLMFIMLNVSKETTITMGAETQKMMPSQIGTRVFAQFVVKRQQAQEFGILSVKIGNISRISLSKPYEFSIKFNGTAPIKNSMAYAASFVYSNETRTDRAQVNLDGLASQYNAHTDLIEHMLVHARAIPGRYEQQQHIRTQQRPSYTQTSLLSMNEMLQLPSCAATAEGKFTPDEYNERAWKLAAFGSITARTLGTSAARLPNFVSPPRAVFFTHMREWMLKNHDATLDGRLGNPDTGTVWQLAREVVLMYSDPLCRLISGVAEDYPQFGTDRLVLFGAWREFARGLGPLWARTIIVQDRTTPEKTEQIVLTAPANALIYRELVAESTHDMDPLEYDLQRKMLAINLTPT